MFAAGHASAGVTAAATSWFLAEGATGDFFDMFVLLANPTTTPADVEIRYLLTTGEVLTKSYTVAPESRRTIYVDDETFAGIGQALASTTLSCAITSTNGADRRRALDVVPRAGGDTRPSGPRRTTPPGRRPTATRWVLADGESRRLARHRRRSCSSPTRRARAGRVRITVAARHAGGARRWRRSSDRRPCPRTAARPCRCTPTPASADTRFGVLVESIDTAPLAQLVVERAMYWNAGGEIWAAGTNLLATPVP